MPGPARWAPLITLAMAVALAGCTSGDDATPTASPSAAAASVAAASLEESEAASASPEASASADATADDPEAYFAAAPEGYEFAELPRQLERRAQDQLEAQPEVERYITDFAMRSVTPDGDPEAIGLVMAVGVEEEYASLPGVERGFATGMAGSGDVQEVQLDDGSGYVVERQGQVVVAWQQQDLLVAVFAANRRDALDVAEALVTR